MTLYTTNHANGDFIVNIILSSNLYLSGNFTILCVGALSPTPSEFELFSPANFSTYGYESAPTAYQSTSFVKLIDCLNYSTLASSSCHVTSGVDVMCIAYDSSAIATSPIDSPVYSSVFTLYAPTITPTPSPSPRPTPKPTFVSPTPSPTSLTCAVGERICDSTCCLCDAGKCIDDYYFYAFDR